jgi:Leucine-rich repeat (LRR) protein
LSLYKNFINEIQNLEGLPLIELNLGGNLIVSCWRGLNGHILLRKLTINNNQISSLKGLEVLDSLRMLNIAENNIDKIFEIK